MIASIWRFHVHPESTRAFERIHGPFGEWAQLFARAEGYVGTELLRLDGADPVYLSIDRWHSPADHQQAEFELDAEYAALDLLCEDFTSEETCLGIHTVIG